VSITPRPSEASKTTSTYGCDFNEGRYRVTDSWYEVIGGGQFDPNTCLVFEMQPLNKNGDEAGQKGYNRYSAGSVVGKDGAGFYPENEDQDHAPNHQPEEGDKGVFLNGPRKPEEYCSMNCLLGFMVKNKGFREQAIMADARCFVGLTGQLGNEKFNPPGTRKEFTIPVFQEISTYPYESGDGGGGRRRRSRGAGATPATPAPATAEQAIAPTPVAAPAATTTATPTVDSDVREAAIEFLQQVTTGKYKPQELIGKSTVKKDVVALALDDNDLTDQQRAALGEVISDNDFLDQAGKEIGFTLLGRKIQID
jgi:hypothetical protein